MNLSEIEAFLAIVDTLSISKAAETLYLTQSTISHRLKSLENELETLLIVRGNGHRSVFLTPRGKEFVKIAREWMSLREKTYLFKKERLIPSISIGCADSLNLYVFSNLYNQILNVNAPITLHINTHGSLINYKLLENREIDIGFVLAQARYKDIIVQPLFSEPMLLVRHSTVNHATGSIHPSELNPKNELVCNWGTEYQRWHDYWWNPAIKPFISINAPSFISHFIYNSDCWAIMPISIAKLFEEKENFEVRNISEPPPNRICYKIIRRNEKSEKKVGMGFFDDYLKKFLSETDWLQTVDL
ncbi:MAG: LysR family transcriptional regulator [Veillonellales bacterium]